MTRRRGDNIGGAWRVAGAECLHMPVSDGHSTTGEGHTHLPHSSHEKTEENGLKNQSTTCPTNIPESLSLDLGKPEGIDRFSWEML